MEITNSLELQVIIRKVRMDLRDLHTKELELKSHLDFLSEYFQDLTSKESTEYNLKEILEYHYPNNTINKTSI